MSVPFDHLSREELDRQLSPSLSARDAAGVNDAVGLNSADVARLSPLHRRPLNDLPVRLLIGSAEPDAFQAQTGALHAAWSAHLSHLSVESVAGCDHFDILDLLSDPNSPTGRFMLGPGR
jgi:arylformamidase